MPASPLGVLDARLDDFHAAWTRHARGLIEKRPGVYQFPWLRKAGLTPDDLAEDVGARVRAVRQSVLDAARPGGAARILTWSFLGAGAGQVVAHGAHALATAAAEEGEGARPAKAQRATGSRKRKPRTPRVPR